MPQTHTVARAEPEVYALIKPSSNVQEQVHILERASGEVYVHYVGKDKRLDEWVPEDQVSAEPLAPSRKRKRGRPPSDDSRRTPRQRLDDDADALPVEPTENVVVMTEEDFDIEHHKRITAHRNFDKVNFADWQIKTWYYSPYPLTESEDDNISASGALRTLQTQTESSTPSSFGVPRAPTIRSHPRTSDLLAGGLGRSHGATDSVLWVCDRCFKYMVDGISWEYHKRKCTVNHPPGRKVYQRGAHTIWEVDGAKEKLYCQNLSLFGKLFIDVKTLFFDTDNFLFYILTDADSTRDHVLGFFSKEKISFDTYNLACIITLPPFQRKGYGMLMIEFSYELSRRANERGTPERPLSDLGLRSYLTYWIAVLVRYLRRLLSAFPPEQETANGRDRRRRKKSAKGWDGEKLDEERPQAIREGPLPNPLYNSRVLKQRLLPDGSGRTDVVVDCTLDDLAAAVGLRVEDAAFALNEVGLLRISDHAVQNDSVAEDSTSSGSTPFMTPATFLCISREMVEAVAKQKKIKRPCMDLSFVLL